MCDFISWIKKDGAIFYLTDKEVFSEEGEKKLKGCLHNDFIGHGAIREFWHIKGGTDHEVRDFWNTEKLPKELAEKLKSIESFDAHWSRMLKEGYFQNDDLRYIIEYAPDTWKERAKRLLK